MQLTETLRKTTHAVVLLSSGRARWWKHQLSFLIRSSWVNRVALPKARLRLESHRKRWSQSRCRFRTIRSSESASPRVMPSRQGLKEAYCIKVKDQRGVLYLALKTYACLLISPIWGDDLGKSQLDGHVDCKLSFMPQLLLLQRDAGGQPRDPN